MKSKSKTLQHRGFIAIAFAGFAATSTVHATTYYWDTNGTTEDSGDATGTWDTSTANWTTDFFGVESPSAVTTTTEDNLFFSAGTAGTAGTVTVSGTQAANNITFDDPVEVTISGGTGITLGGTTGAGVFQQTGSAANIISTGLTLGSAVTAFNFTNSTASLLTIGAVTGSATTGTQTVTLTPNSGGITLNGIISDGAGGGLVALASASTGVITISGANTYSGGTGVGTNNVTTTGVHATSSGALGSGTVFITGNNSRGRLELTGDITLANAITQGGRATSVGAFASILNVSGNNTLSGTVTVVTGGTHSTIQSDSGLLTLSNATAITVGAPATGARGILLTGAGDIAVTGAITNGTGTLQLNKRGAGTVTLSGANTNTGKTTVTAGTLQFAQQTSLYNNNTASWTAANINVASGATLALNVGGSGEFTSIDLNTLLTNISVAGSATVGLQSGAKIALDTTNAGGSFTQGDVIADSTGANGGAIGLTKLGTGTLVLDKTNTYTGDTTVTAGVLAVDGDAIPNAGKLVINGSGQVDPMGATEMVGSLYFDDVLQPGGTYSAVAGPGVDFVDAHFTGTGVVSVVVGYSAWANAYAPGQGMELDHDGDGVTNGIEYFMGQTDSTFTANPAVAGGTVTWPMGATYTGVYGTDYEVETSANLVDWAPVPIGTGDNTVAVNPGPTPARSVVYNMPTGGKSFVRLVVSN